MRKETLSFGIKGDLCEKVKEKIDKGRIQPPMVDLMARWMSLMGSILWIG